MPDLNRPHGDQPDPVDVAVGARIRLRRKQLGISQSMLADAIGVTFQQVQKYERGANRVSASTIAKVAPALKCKVSDLFGETEGDDAAPAGDRELFAVLKTPGATDMLQAYAGVRSSDARTALINLARSISGRAPSAAAA